MTTIIYDSTAKVGHNAEYIRHLILYILNNKSLEAKTYIFILHPTIISLIGVEYASSNYENNLVVIPLPDAIKDNLLVPDNMYNRYRNSNIETAYINSQLLFFDAERIILMMIDTELFTIRKLNYFNLKEISGIYMRPLPPVCSQNSYIHKKIIYLFKRIVKIKLINFLLNEEKLKFVFILEDIKLITHLQKIITKTKFIYLPDPFERLHTKGEHNSSHVQLASDKSEYLLVFGVMEPRKNLINIIKAFYEFSRSVDNTDLNLLIVGKFVSTEYKFKVSQLIDVLFKTNKNRVILHDCFIDDQERDLILAEAKVILMPYLNFQGSSGVLGHSVIYKKPAIVSNVGLAAELVTTFKLGLTVDPSSINEIERAMHQSLTFKLDNKLRELFLQSRTPTSFSTILLDN